MCIIHVFVILRNYPNKILLYPVIIRDTNFHIFFKSCLSDLGAIALISAPCFPDKWWY